MLQNLNYAENKQLLENYKIAFLCSRKCPADIILKSYDWAIEQRETASWQSWRTKYLSPMPYQVEILKSSLPTCRAQGKKFQLLNHVKKHED